MIMIHRLEAQRVQTLLRSASRETLTIFKKGGAGRGGIWHRRERPLCDYEQTFASVLPMPLNEYVANYLNGREVYGLDLMGEAQPLRDLKIKGLGVTIVDIRLVRVRLQDEHSGIEILATTYKQDGSVDQICDLFRKETRRKIKGYLTERNIPGFDLILCRPGGAIYRIPDDPSVGYFLLNTFWRLLNSDYGILLTEVRPETSKSLPDWVPYFQEAKIDMRVNRDVYPFQQEYGSSVLSLVKKPEAPKELPIIPNRGGISSK